MNHLIFVLVQMYRADPIFTISLLAMTILAGFGFGYAVLGPLLF